MKPPFPKWRDQYPITDADHTHDLETQAALNEFMHKLPRHEAEAEAHRSYRKEQLAEAAAHHYLGMKSAHAAGAKDEAKKHGVFYALALKELGHEPVGDLPPDVSAKVKNLEQTAPPYRFKPHKGDSFAIPENLQKTEGSFRSYRREKGESSDEFHQRVAGHMKPHESVDTEGGSMCRRCLPSSGYEHKRLKIVPFTRACYNCGHQELKE
jgi:hypothetical protein